MSNSRKLKEFVKLLLPPFLTNSIKSLKHKETSPYFGLNEMDRKLEKYLNFDNGFFIELGANDGLTQSNTAYFEKNKNWHGILIEPIPHRFLECLENRSSRNHILCCACVPFNYKEKFVEILYSNLMSVPTSLKQQITDPTNHANIGLQFLPNHETTFSFGSLAKTLNSILEEANSPEIIDFISLDVEGAEIDVLQGIDHERYKFRFLLIENRDFKELDAYLQSIGYEFLEKLSHHDYLFKPSATTLKKL